jgi:hypothetical protein
MGYLRLMEKELFASVDEHGVWRLCGTAAGEFATSTESGSKQPDSKTNAVNFGVVAGQCVFGWKWLR